MGTLRGFGHRALNALHEPVGKIALQRALRNASPILLELGAWRTARSDWIATDVSWRSPHYLDVTRAWPIASSSVDAIFSDNVVEHLSLSSAQVAFREAFRVLRPGGVMRTVTPDIGALVELYRAGPQAAAALREELVEEGYHVAHQVDVLRFAFQDDGHHEGYLWDRNSLEAELSAAGFTHIEFRSPGESRHSLMQGLDMRTDVPLAEAMLAADAVKPV